MFTFATLGTILSIIAGILFILMIPFKIMLSGAILLLSKLDRGVDKSFRKKIAEYGGSGRGAVGTTAQVAGGAVQAGGKGVQVAGKGVKAGGKGVEVAGTATKVGGKVTSGVGKGTQYAGKGVQAGGKGVQAAGEAVTVIPYVGTVIGTVVKAGGVGVEYAGKGVEYGGKGVEYGGKGIQYAGSAGQKIGQGVQKVGDTTDRVGSRIEGAGASIASIGADGEGAATGAGLNIARLSTRLAIKALKLFIRAIRFILSLIELLIPIIIAIITLLGVIGVMIVAAIVAAAAACIFVVMGGGYTGTGTNPDGTKIVADNDDAGSNDPTTNPKYQNYLNSCQVVWDSYRKDIKVYDCKNGRGHKCTALGDKEVGAYCSGYVLSALDHAGYDMLNWTSWNQCPNTSEIDDLIKNGSEKECMKKFMEDFEFIKTNEENWEANELYAGDIIFYVTADNHSRGGDIGQHMEICAGVVDGKVLHWNWGQVYDMDDAPEGQPHNTGNSIKDYLYKPNRKDSDGNADPRKVSYIARMKGTKGGSSVAVSNANWVKSILSVSSVMSQDCVNLYTDGQYYRGGSLGAVNSQPTTDKLPLCKALIDSVNTDKKVTRVMMYCNGLPSFCLWYYSKGEIGVTGGGYASHLYFSSACIDWYNSNGGDYGGEVVNKAWLNEHFEPHTQAEVKDGKYKPVAGDIAFFSGHAEVYMGLNSEGKVVKCNFGGNGSIKQMADNAKAGKDALQTTGDDESTYINNVVAWMHCKDK